MLYDDFVDISELFHWKIDIYVDFDEGKRSGSSMLNLFRPRFAYDNMTNPGFPEATPRRVFTGQGSEQKKEHGLIHISL